MTPTPARSLRSLALAGLGLAAAIIPTGCCSFSHLFCGPEESPWISRDDSTHQAAVRTFLEAARREDWKTLFDAMSTDLKKNIGLGTSFEQTIAQKLFKQELPYLYVAGYADPGEAEMSQDGNQATYSFEIEGYPATLVFRRQLFWQVDVAVEYQDEWAPAKDYLKGSSDFSKAIRVVEDPYAEEGGAVLQLEPPLRFRVGTMAPLEEDIRGVRLGIEWKLSSYRFEQ